MDQDHTPLLKWDDIVNIIRDDRLELLGRSQEQRRVYREFRARIENEWESLRDYILCSKLDIQSCIGSTGKLAATKFSIVSPLMKILPNDFPYNFEEGKYSTISA